MAVVVMRTADRHPGHTESVLLIEDNRDIAELVCAYLERRGYEVDYAGDGVTGLHLAVTGAFDAIVLDLMLPGIDGLDICHRLRQDARRDVPILMLTARDTLEDKIRGLDTGADDYLVKPFDIRELEARLRALIRRRRGLLTPEILRVADSRARSRDAAGVPRRRRDPGDSDRDQDSCHAHARLAAPGRPARDRAQHLGGRTARQRRAAQPPLYPAQIGGPAVRHRAHPHRAERRLPARVRE